MSYFQFAGKDFRDFGVNAFQAVNFTGARHEYSQYNIPGKSGDLIIDGQRHPNIAHAYDVIIYQNFMQNYDNMRNFLLSRVGYQTLKDSFNPDEFYKAVFKDDVALKIDTTRNMGKGRIEFIRKPQRYLISGETTVEFTTSGSISNPTLFDSMPLIRIYGTGTVGIADNAITVTSADEYTDIDCEIMEAYKGTESKNAFVEIQNNDFPVLHPGYNGITLDYGVTKVEVKPRWYKL